MCVPQVLLYLQALADRFHLQELVRFSTEVVRAEPVDSTAAHQPNSAAASTQQQPHQQQQQAEPQNLPLPWQRWQVTWRELGAAGTQPNSSSSSAAASTTAAGSVACAAGDPASVSTEHTELFDALLVCNGHYTEPNVPDIPGAAGFPGVLMHSHNYRRADRFRGQHVTVIGPSYSGAPPWTTQTRRVTHGWARVKQIQYMSSFRTRSHIGRCCCKAEAHH
jgi:hypothetical protein